MHEERQARCIRWYRQFASVPPELAAGFSSRINKAASIWPNVFTLGRAHKATRMWWLKRQVSSYLFTVMPAYCPSLTSCNRYIYIPNPTLTQKRLQSDLWKYCIQSSCLQTEIHTQPHFFSPCKYFYAFYALSLAWLAWEHWNKYSMSCWSEEQCICLWKLCSITVMSGLSANDKRLFRLKKFLKGLLWIHYLFFFKNCILNNAFVKLLSTAKKGSCNEITATPLWMPASSRI